VLLGAPDSNTRIETVNDKDGYVANFWRAVQAAPDGVAQWASWPVNENDLHARHVWLRARGPALVARLEGDPRYYDAQIAGWWACGLSCWIGSGFCGPTASGPWVVQEDEDGPQRVHLGNAGRGVTRKRVHLGNAGQGVTRRRVHLGNAGQGVTRRRVHLGNAGQGDAGTGEQGVRAWMRALATRLARVRVCSGDWSRVCGETPTTKLGLTGILLDPPYSDESGRTGDLYACDDQAIAHDVRRWAAAHGDDPRLRIALCGYAEEHDLPGWTAVPWKASGGYGSQGDGVGRANATREMVWFSPYCLQPCQPQGDLFEALAP
jgi:hypothetical protein